MQGLYGPSAAEVQARPDLGCPGQPKAGDDQVVRAGLEAWSRLKQCKTWADWLLVGEALLVGRTEAMRTAHTNKPVGRRYGQEFGDWLTRSGALALAEIDKSIRSRLFECMSHRDEIEAWRKTLPLSLKLSLNHPNVILRRWQKTKAKPDNTPRLPSHVEKLKTSIAELEQENHRLRRETAFDGPFTRADKDRDIAGVVERIVIEPARMRTIARELNRKARLLEARKEPVS